MHFRSRALSYPAVRRWRLLDLHWEGRHYVSRSQEIKSLRTDGSLRRQLVWLCEHQRQTPSKRQSSRPPGGDRECSPPLARNQPRVPSNLVRLDLTDRPAVRFGLSENQVARF